MKKGANATMTLVGRKERRKGVVPSPYNIGQRQGDVDIDGLLLYIDNQ